MVYAEQGHHFCLGGQGAKNFTYANRVSRDGWEQRELLGEVGKLYTSEDEFCDSLVRHIQSQYEVAESQGRKIGGDSDMK